MGETADSAETLVDVTLHPRVRIGSAVGLSEETSHLLRFRLRLLSALLLGIVLLLTFKALFAQGIVASSAEGLSVLIVLLASTVILFSPLQMSIGWLRAVELVVFGWSTISTLWVHYVLMNQAVAAGDQGTISAQHQHMVLPFVLLIFLYALFIPATWKRAALVIGSITVSVIALRIVLVVQNPQLREYLNVEQTTQAGVLLILSSISAIFGSHVINGLRVEAFKSRQLGQYMLKEKLGSGGMGEVWRADHRLLARPAAVKLIRPEMLGDRTVAQNVLRRFEREAQATAALTSPHTITVYDFGVTDDRAFYYVMELLDGCDFGKMVKGSGPVPAGRVIYLISQVCDSLAEAHFNGLIHRDIKPSNLFACRLGNEADFVKVLDFGLVKSSGVEPPGEQQLTRVGVLTGTPGFMSPEQITGENLDGRSDLYALGCVAYSLLTGTTVFEGDGAMAVAIQHVKDCPIPPSRRAGIPVPADLEEVVLSCLEKSPDRRPPDAMTLRRRLRSCSSAQDWDDEKARDWWRDHGPVCTETGG